MMPRIVSFTAFPPPVTGQSVMTNEVAEWAEGVTEVVRLDTSPKRLTQGRGRHLARMVRLWSRLVRTVRPGDVVYTVLSSSRAGRMRDAVTVALAHRWGARVVGHVQVGDFAPSLRLPGQRRVSLAMMRHVDTLVVLSARLVPDGVGDVRVVPNTAPGMAVSDAELDARRTARAGAQTLRVVFLANVLPGKGQDVLLGGLAAYAAGSPARPPEVDVVGAWPTPERRRRFEARALSLGIPMRVWGAVAARAQVREILLGSDVVALPSRYTHEALPVSLIEGLATGTPVIGSRYRAIPDIVTPETGVLLADESPATIAAALTTLADPAVWRRCSVGARAAFETRFAPDVVRPLMMEALGLD